MTDKTNASGSTPRPTAKIYQFPATRRAPAKAVEKLPKLTSYPWESGWYHEDAIGEETVKPAMGPAA